MKLNKLFHDDKEWVEYKVYKKSLMQKDSSYAEILFDKDKRIEQLEKALNYAKSQFVSACAIGESDDSSTFELTIAAILQNKEPSQYIKEAIDEIEALSQKEEV